MPTACNGKRSRDTGGEDDATGAYQRPSPIDEGLGLSELQAEAPGDMSGGLGGREGGGPLNDGGARGEVTDFNMEGTVEILGMVLLERATRREVCLMQQGQINRHRSVRNCCSAVVGEVRCIWCPGGTASIGVYSRGRCCGDIVRYDVLLLSISFGRCDDVGFRCTPGVSTASSTCVSW